MYRYSNGQISLSDFKQPVGMNLKESNRWVKKAQTIPWLDIEKRYAALFTNRKGNVAKPLRLALSTCIIQAEYGYSDEETGLQIQENPYLQYFCGYPGYDDEHLPFDPSLMVYFRKRLTPEVLGEINEMISVLKNYRAIVRDFAAIPVEAREAVRVGVVGEIFVKYSPLGNNDLERFLIREGAEPVVPGLLDFCLYSVYDSIMEHEVYGRHRKSYPLWKFAYDWLNKKRGDISAVLTESGRFRGFAPFEQVVQLAGEVIHTTVKMGEGWLLPAEMLELSESGCKNIVCTQPFGCLPNHICGKGMMKPIKERHPDTNIVAIDYDAGASRVNQENRLKLMLSNAKR